MPSAGEDAENWEAWAPLMGTENGVAPSKAVWQVFRGLNTELVMTQLLHSQGR